MIAFAPEQEAFRKSVARFVDAEVAPAAAALDERGEFPARLFRRIGELGYLGIEMIEAARDFFGSRRVFRRRAAHRHRDIGVIKNEAVIDAA